jgi:hypothetical protein
MFKGIMTKQLGLQGSGVWVFCFGFRISCFEFLMRLAVDKPPGRFL